MKRGFLVALVLAIGASVFAQHARTLGRPVGELRDLSAPIFSPNGRLIATDTDSTQDSRLWVSVFDAVSMKRLWSKPELQRGGKRFSPDGTLLAIAGTVREPFNGSDLAAVAVYESLTGRVVSSYRWPEFRGINVSVRVSPTNEFMAVTINQRSSILRVSTGEPVYEIDGEAWFSPDGARLLVIDFFTGAYVADAPTGKVLQFLDGEYEPRNVIGQSGNSFFSDEWGTQVIEFDWTTFSPIRFLSMGVPGTGFGSRTFKLDPDGQTYWIVGNDSVGPQVRKLSLKTGALLSSTPALDVDPWSDRLVRTRETMEVPEPPLISEFSGRRAHLETITEAGDLVRSHIVPVSRVWYGPVDPSFSVRHGHHFGYRTLVDAITGTTIRRAAGSLGSSFSTGTAFATYFAFNWPNYTIRAVDRNLNMLASFAGPVLNQFPVHPSDFTGRFQVVLEPGPNGSVLASQWDAVTGKVAPIPTTTPSVSIRAVPGPGTRFGLIRFDYGVPGRFDVVDRTTMQTVRTLFGPNLGDICGASFSPDGSKVVLSEDWRGSMDVPRSAVYSVASGLKLFTLEGQDEDLVETVFTPDGTTLITLDTWGTVRTWSASNGDPIATYPFATCGGRYNRIEAVSPDGKRIAVANDGLTVIELVP